MSTPECLERLLEAHLQHELMNWQGDSLPHTVNAIVAEAFRWFATVRVGDVVTRQQIEGIIRRFVIELRVSGAITELSGELSRLVFRSPVTQQTRVDEILSPTSYEEFVEKLLGLEKVRRYLINVVAQTFASNEPILAGGLLGLIAPRIPLDRAALAAPWLQFVERMAEQAAPQLKQRASDWLTAQFDRRRESVARAVEDQLVSVLRPERLRSLLDDLWDVVGAMRLSEAFALMGEQDLEDFVVLNFEFYQHYRKTDFFRHISSEMVDYFFSKYEEESVASLIEEMGVSERMVNDELTGVLQPAIERALASGAIEQVVRARLLAFYTSPAALRALEK